MELAPMPTAIIAAGQAVVSYIGAAGAAVAAGGATLAQYATVIAVNAAQAYAGYLLTAPRVPSPEETRQVRRQPIPPRVSGYGRARLGGAYMLYETDGTNENLALNVFAMHDGLIAGWGDIYLNDKTVTVMEDTYVLRGPDLRYGKFSDLVRIETRVGHPTETNYAQVTAARADVWPSNARGDGIASLMMIAKAKEKEQFVRDYPNGLPLPSAVGDLQYCWDPRLGARGTITDDDDKEASATWVGGSQNPVLQLLDYMTNPSTGMGLPLSRFLPNIAAWSAAADVCEEAVPLAAGGTVPRYLSGGTYLHSTPPADVIATILATFDGWLTEDASGCFIVYAGEYVAPSVTITEDHIVSLSRQFFREDERATNEIIASYTDPSFDFTEVEADPWREEADIEARGDVRSQPLSLPWVPNNSQARRLAKIAARKSVVPISGTLTTTLDGLRVWSERRIRIQAPSDGSVMADIVVDVQGLTLNNDNTVTIPFTATDPTMYEWDAATEEGAGAGGDTRPDNEPIQVPVIEEVEVFNTTEGATRLRVFFGNPTPGLTYVVRWRVAGADTWTNEAEQTSVIDGGYPYVETGLVTPSSLEVSARLIAASGAPSEWSDPPFEVDATVITPMGQPTNFSAYPQGEGAGGTVEMTAQAPNHPSADHLVFYAGSSSSFGSATDVSGDLPAAALEFASFSYSTTGTVYVWVEAFDAMDVGSGPLGPIVVTVPL